jgi:hypothetical protein
MMVKEVVVLTVVAVAVVPAVRHLLRPAAGGPMVVRPSVALAEVAEVVTALSLIAILPMLWWLLGVMAVTVPAASVVAVAAATV